MPEYPHPDDPELYRDELDEEARAHRLTGHPIGDETGRYDVDQPTQDELVAHAARERLRNADELQVKEMIPKAFVLHSGGIDSTTCLYLAVRDFGIKHVVSLSIDYGQRHSTELDHAQAICEARGIEHHMVKGPEMPQSMLTDPDATIPDVAYMDLDPGISPTYVPFRNGTLLSYVAAIAQAQAGTAIYFGAHAEDALNWAYPDCTPEFIGAMANAIFIGTYQQVRLLTPLAWLGKKEIIQLGTSLDIPWERTWSCYKGGVHHCGTCPTCRARHQGFFDAQVVDPTKYEFTPNVTNEDPDDIPF